MAPNPPILEIVRENLSATDYNNKSAIDSSSGGGVNSFIDGYHSPEYCFEQTTSNYLLRNEAGE